MHRIRLQASLLFVIIATLTSNSIFIPSVYAKDADHGRPGIVVDITKAMIAEKVSWPVLPVMPRKSIDDWMWTLIGGYENLVTGNLAGDAYIVQIREKVNNYAEIIDAIQRFILAIEDGRYDDATLLRSTELSHRSSFGQHHLGNGQTNPTNLIRPYKRLVPPYW